MFTDHDDLWQSLRVLWYLLASEQAQPGLSNQPMASVLGLPVLNGDLFAAQAIDGCTITNRDLLEALWRLTWYQESGSSVPRRVNYAALDVEELGSVYESLLEFHPAVAVDHAGRPGFRFVTGSERKTTGSYYTPPELVAELIKSALEPVISDRLDEARRMASGEWRMVKEEWRRGFLKYASERLSRPGGVAAGLRPGQSGVPTDQSVSEGGAVRDGLADTPSGHVDSGEYRGGLGTPLLGGVHPVSPEGQRQSDRAGNSAHSFSRSRALQPGSDQAADQRDDNPGQATRGSRTELAPTERELTARWQGTPFAIRYSRLAASAILSLRVCDPACGSGHFLLAAARRLGRELARVDTGEDEPAPERVREAIREIVSHCIYGVDKNPLAVDLCRVALWLESHTADKPLTFLDHRIRPGDSLVGVFDLAVLKAGIPDKAFDPLEGDDKATAREVARRNREERGGTRDLQRWNPDALMQDLNRQSRALDAIADDSPGAIHRKKDLYQRERSSPAWQRQKQACDLWTAAFFQPLQPDQPAITTARLAEHLAGNTIDGRLSGIARTFSDLQPFFHWPLEFPEVFADGGFDAILSNPPWERIKLQEQEFFAVRDARIASAANKAARAKLIRELPDKHPELYRQFVAALRTATGATNFMRHGGRFPLTGRGDINTYAVFAELSSSTINQLGRAGLVLPKGIATDDTTKFFFSSLVEAGRLIQLIGFENEDFIFPAVDHRVTFCATTVGGGAQPEIRSRIAFYIRRFSQLGEENRFFSLEKNDFWLLNPNTGNCPIFRTRADAELTKAIYRRVPVAWREANETRTEVNPWKLSFRTLFHMANDSHYFRTADVLLRDGYQRGQCFYRIGRPLSAPV